MLSGKRDENGGFGAHPCSVVKAVCTGQEALQQIVPSGVEKQLVPAQGALRQLCNSIRTVRFVFLSVHFTGVSQLSLDRSMPSFLEDSCYSQSNSSPAELERLSRGQEPCGLGCVLMLYPLLSGGTPSLALLAGSSGRPPSRAAPPGPAAAASGQPPRGLQPGHRFQGQTLLFPLLLRFGWGRTT